VENVTVEVCISYWDLFSEACGLLNRVLMTRMMASCVVIDAGDDGCRCRVFVVDSLG